MANKKILIVEDEKPLANALSLKLNSSGFDTQIMHNGDDALEAAVGDKYDLVLLDLMMPKRDGFSVLTELKEKNNKTPVFIMSNLGQEEDVNKAKSLGAVDYIIKSDTPLSVIVSKINTFFNK